MPKAFPQPKRSNAPWTPLQRRTWLATQRRRNHGLQPPPVLRAAYPDLLRWSWDYPNPFKWNVWMSMDGGSSYILIEDYWMYGDARQFAPDGGGELYYITGIDDTGREITKHSNIIRPEDAPAPAVFYFVDDLVGYWKLDEAAGNDRRDASGWGWDLTEWSFVEANGDDHIPIGRNNGRLNYAADFGDGSEGKGLVSFLPNSWFSGDFTFSCWVNYNSDTGYDGQGLISVGGTVQIGIRAYDQAVNFALMTDSGPGYLEALTPNDSIAERVWTHLAFVKTATTLLIYINGVEQASAPITGSLVPTETGFFSATDLIVGINPFGYPLVGCVDEIGCWVRALTAPEVTALYNNGDGLGYDDF